ncbi:MULTISPECIES: hybrid-cluster NAD(P)-dependent oxidoreductase [unclassified Brevibacterium]|uniref:hybrid-cluster NAD(P)-dependent oxidoreductase n=1 Tax=unclassified Brevibacterium TaxID=2614124 RepID=UPI001092BEE8|nr:hybrid-cluster NAD(P)-dependent oxidoreductase [Brevibacterium sp. S22]TGD32546.1 hybrid-cluster NAD(P)-dependent oxidoreductase [Brevibacterium sp. S22]
MRYRHSTFVQATSTPVGKATFRVPTRGRRLALAAAAPPVVDAAVESALAAPVDRVHAASADPVFAELQLDPELLTGPVEVTGITQVTHDVKTFELRAGWMSAVDFAPGQYVTMRIPELGLERCYSFSSAPFGTNIFTITVKRVPGGAVSTYLHDSIRVGDRLHVDGPYGLFSTSFHPAERHLFLSAGSGITPIMAMVRSLLARQGGPVMDIAFVHSAATPADIIFRAELEQLAEVAGVSVTILCSRDGESETWTGRRGRIDTVTLAEVVPDVADRETFVCGPGPYMDAVRPLLAEAGVPSVRTHEESFVFATSPADRLARAGARAKAAGAGVAGVSHAVEFAISGRVVDCDESTTVLDSALDAGLSVPSSCSEGACGTCKSVLISGEVEMKHAGGIRPKEIAAGKFLPCCSTPLTDLVVER